MLYNFCVPCLFGLEGPIADELKRLGMDGVRADNGRVYFTGDESALCRANLRSRFAERILLVMGRFEAKTFDALFEGTKALPWENFIPRDAAFPVKGWSLESALHSVPDCQRIVKKAVVERLKAVYGLEWFAEEGRRSYGRVQDQVTAVGRELFSDFFDRYPHIRMVHSMLGGAFFAISNMLLPQAAKRKDAVQRFQADDGSLAARLREHIYFEMSHAQPWGKAQLECAVKALGADHILFGSSYPVRPVWLLEGADFVRNLDITEEEKELILHKNAEKLYHL